MKHKGRGITPHLIMDGVKADTLEFRSIWHYRIFNRIFCITIYVLTFVFRLLISVRDKAVCSNLYHFIHTVIWVLVLSSAWGYAPGSSLFSGRAFATGFTPAFEGYFFVIFGVLEICTFVAKNRPEFSRSWVEESNALTRNPRFRR